MANQVRPYFISLGRRFLLPSDYQIMISPGKGRHGTDGHRGKQACLVQFIYRLVYSKKVKPGIGNFDFKIFDHSPLGSKVLQAMASYDPEWGINFLDTMRKYFNEMTECFMQFYIPPGTQSTDIQARARYCKYFN